MTARFDLPPIVLRTWAFPLLLSDWNSLPADLTDNFNNMLSSGFKHSLRTYFYKLSFVT